MEALFRSVVEAMAASGWSDAGGCRAGSREAGFHEIDEGERGFWCGTRISPARRAYAADVIERARAAPPGAETELRAGLEDLRSLAGHLGAASAGSLHKSTAVR